MVAFDGAGAEGGVAFGLAGTRYPARSSGWRWLEPALFLGLPLFIILAVIGREELRTDLAAWFLGAPTRLGRAFLDLLLFNTGFHVALAIGFFLQWRFPARPAERALSAGLRQDLLWTVLTAVMYASLAPAYMAVLREFYHRYLDFLTIGAVADWPWLARLFLAFLVMDFTGWVAHWLSHKLPVVWSFHAIHHTQRQINFFTENRGHPIDFLFNFTVRFIPILMVEHAFVSLIILDAIRHWLNRLVHANIRTDLGPLRYILVTPQSHRIHHSIEPPHLDTNFGTTLSLWDHLFGTQYRGYDEYPETGLNDPTFPLEQRHGWRSGLRLLAGQLAHPFVVTLRRWRSPPAKQLGQPREIRPLAAG